MTGSADMEVTVLMYGPARDAAGGDKRQIRLPAGATVADLRASLSAQVPALAAALPTMRIAVNQAFALESDELHATDEVALIPPVSGGCPGGGGTDPVRVTLPRHRIDTGAVRDFVMGDPELGGICTFEGATRIAEDPRQGDLEKLEYEAYDAMAERQLRRLAEEAMRRFAVARVAVAHRLGDVPPAEVSIMIMVAAGHRAPAFDACRWLIDTIKSEVPIWKRAVYANGSRAWVPGSTRRSPQESPS